MMKRLLTVAKIILFIAIFSVITHIMNYYLVQSNWASIDRWQIYGSKSDVDTLFVGSSLGWVVVPRTIDALNASNCVNMSTPNQFYKTSAEAVEFISGQQPLDTVVLLTGFEGLECAEDYGASAAFYNAWYETAPLLTRYGAILSWKISRYTDPAFLASTDSVNAWFDWVESFTYSVPEITKNVVYRRSRKDPGYVLDLGANIERIPAGISDAATLKEDTKRAQGLGLTCIDIDPASLKALDEMASYLSANNIRFKVIVTPHRSDVRGKYGMEYDAIDSYLNEFVTKRGGEYFNLDNDPVLREKLPDEMFMDEEHIVDEGNDIVSSVIAELIR